MRQIAHETDGIAQQHLHSALEFPGAGLGIQRGEEPVIGISSGGGERVEQRALARVGVSDDANREMLARALGHEPAFALLNALDLLAQMSDAFAHQAAVDFELLLAGSARADAGRRAAGDALQMSPHARQARISVLHLRQLDLEPGLVRLRPRRENVQDQFGAIQNFDALQRRAGGFLVDDLFQRPI